MIQNTNYGASKTYVNTKVDKLTTSGLKAYTHDGATQGEIDVSNAYTPATLALRDSNGRLVAADPASGATDKTLTTANWVSQTGDSAPNNLLHKTGNETKDGTLTLLKSANIRTSGVYIGGTSPIANDHVSIRAMLKIKINYDSAVRFTVIGTANNQNTSYGEYILTFSRSGSTPALFCLNRCYSNVNVNKHLYFNIENNEIKIYGLSLQFCTMEVSCIDYYKYGHHYDPPEGYELKLADNVSEIVTLPDTAVSDVMLMRD